MPSFTHDSISLSIKSPDKRLMPGIDLIGSAMPLPSTTNNGKIKESSETLVSLTILLITSLRRFLLGLCSILFHGCVSLHLEVVELFLRFFYCAKYFLVFCFFSERIFCTTINIFCARQHFHIASPILQF